jgi:hypothetical protein
MFQIQSAMIGQRLPNGQRNASIESLRKLLTIVLLAFIGLPFASPLLALRAKIDSGVRACCRRSGKHHCLMSAGERAKLSQGAQAFSSPTEKCPYCPASIAIVHSDAFAPHAAQAVYAGLTAHPAVVAQTESKMRTSCARSRQKRGPPTLSL